MALQSRLPAVRRPNEVTTRSRPLSMIEGNTTYAAASAPDADPPKKAKRRSLLPQFSRKVSNEERDGIREEDEEEDGGDGYRPPTQEPQEPVEEENRRQAIDADRRAMPPPSKLSRPTSMVPPRGSNQLGRMQAPRTHARQGAKEKETESNTAREQSLAALTGAASPALSKVAQSEPGLHRSGSTKLPQSPRPTIPSRTTSAKSELPERKSGLVNGNMSAESTTVALPKRSTSVRTQGHSRIGSTLGSRDLGSGNQTATTVNRTPTTSIAEKRASASITRPPVLTSSTPNQTSRTISPTSPQRSSAMSRPRPGSYMQSPSGKPAFNTYQQHYSPAKSALPKPPIPSTKTSKPVTASEEEAHVTFDIVKQQIELLQLSLLHQSSEKCTQEYTASAKRKLGKKHTKLRKDYESIRATELVHQRAANLAALEAWCSDPGMLVENLQILSLVYSDLTALIDDGSRHSDVVRVFEGWADGADAAPSQAFVRSLPDDWKSAHVSLALKLRSIQRNLGVLPPVRSTDFGEEASGLAIVLKDCKTLVDGMSKELDAMIRLEKEILARESQRVEEEVKLLIDGSSSATAWTPAWQNVS